MKACDQNTPNASDKKKKKKPLVFESARGWKLVEGFFGWKKLRFRIVGPSGPAQQVQSTEENTPTPCELALCFQGESEEDFERDSMFSS